MLIKSLAALALWAMTLSLAYGEGQPATLVSYGYRVVASHHHDPSAFTQGLLMLQGQLFESTGGYGQSSLRSTDLATGLVLREQPLPPHLFGEGLAAAGDRLFQLTWKAGIGLVHDAATLRQVGEFRYAGEGWGLASNGEHLVMSDGSAQLRFLDLAHQQEFQRLQVRAGEEPIAGLNELEYVGKDLYANVWPTSRIAIINPQSGQLKGWLDLSNILPVVFRHPRIDVLNGIARDPESGRLFVTGKRWPKLFEIEVFPQASPD